MFSLKKTAGSVFSIAISIGVLWFVGDWLLKDADLDQVLQISSQISLISILLLLASAIFNVWIFQYPYLVTTPSLKFWQAFQVRNASFAISNSLPAGGTIGLSVQYAMLRSFGIGVKEIGATVGIASLWNGLISFFMPVLGLVALILVGQSTQNLVQSTLVGILILIFSLILFYTSLKSSQGSLLVGRLLSILINPIRKIFRKPEIDLVGSINTFRLSVNELVKRKWKSISITNFLVQIGMFLVFLASAKAIGIEISSLVIFAIFCFGRVGTTIPLTPGGLGTTDLIMSSLLQFFGVSPELSLTAVLLWRGFFYIPQVFLGLLSFIYWQLSRGKSRFNPIPHNN